jgi:hypothetical protein
MWTWQKYARLNFGLILLTLTPLNGLAESRSRSRFWDLSIIRAAILHATRAMFHVCATRTIDPLTKAGNQTNFVGFYHDAESGNLASFIDSVGLRGNVANGSNTLY